MMAVSRYYIASDQIQRDEGGLKFFVKKTFSPPIYDQGKTVDETLRGGIGGAAQPEDFRAMAWT